MQMNENTHELIKHTIDIFFENKCIFFNKISSHRKLDVSWIPEENSFEEDLNASLFQLKMSVGDKKLLNNDINVEYRKECYFTGDHKGVYYNLTYDPNHLSDIFTICVTIKKGD